MKDELFESCLGGQQQEKQKLVVQVEWTWMSKRHLSGGKSWTLRVLPSNYSSRSNIKNNAAMTSTYRTQPAIFLVLLFLLGGQSFQELSCCARLIRMYTEFPSSEVWYVIIIWSANFSLSFSYSKAELSGHSASNVYLLHSQSLQNKKYRNCW